MRTKVEQLLVLLTREWKEIRTKQINFRESGKKVEFRRRHHARGPTDSREVRKEISYRGVIA